MGRRSLLVVDFFDFVASPGVSALAGGGKPLGCTSGFGDVVLVESPAVGVVSVLKEWLGVVSSSSSKKPL